MSKEFSNKTKEAIDEAFEHCETEACYVQEVDNKVVVGVGPIGVTFDKVDNTVSIQVFEHIETLEVEKS